jgi:hypothetical protein
MGIPNRQIGWGQEEILLYEISKQLERLSCAICPSTTSTTTTAGPTTTTTTSTTL